MKNMFKLNKKGFTLVELLVVIVILTVLIVITGTTIFPMMGKSQKTAMVTYGGRVLQNASASVQADSLVKDEIPSYYKISVIMDQDDYYGCVKVEEKSDKSGYDYAIKMFSKSDNYYIYAATSELAAAGKADASAKGIIGDNMTITDIDVDTEVEYKTLKVGGTTITIGDDTGETSIKNFEETYCDADDFANITVATS